MKIAFVGSHGIGKSQVIKEIKKLYPNISFIEDIAQKTINKNFNWKMPFDMSYEEKNDFQLTVFMNQMRKELITDNFVSDRTVLDAVVYSKWLHIQGFLKDIAKDYLKRYPYDKIYFVKKEFFTRPEMADDADYSEYQDFIQIELLNLLQELHVDYEELIGLPYERTKKVLSYIKNNIN